MVYTDESHEASELTCVGNVWCSAKDLGFMLMGLISHVVKKVEESTVLLLHVLLHLTFTSLMSVLL